MGFCLRHLLLDFAFAPFQCRFALLSAAAVSVGLSWYFSLAHAALTCLLALCLYMCICLRTLNTMQNRSWAPYIFLHSAQFAFKQQEKNLLAPVWNDDDNNNIRKRQTSLKTSFFFVHFAEWNVFFVRSFYLFFSFCYFESSNEQTQLFFKLNSTFFF